MSDDVQLTDLDWLRDGRRPATVVTDSEPEPSKRAPAGRAAAKRVPQA